MDVRLSARGGLGIISVLAYRISRIGPDQFLLRRIQHPAANEQPNCHRRGGPVVGYNAVRAIPENRCRTGWKTVGAIVAALGLIGGLVVWSHGQLRTDIRNIDQRLDGLDRRLTRIEALLEAHLDDRHPAQ